MSTSSNNKACPNIPDDGCSICGPGKCVTDFETVFAYPNQPAVACGVLEKAGHGGLVPLTECGYLPQIVKDDCKCRSSIPNTSKPTRNPTPSPTRATPSGSACPNIPDGGCSICGPGKCVTDFDNIFAYPGQPAVECGVLEKAGHGAVIPLDQCGYLPQIVKDDCKCRSSIPAAPKPTHQPTPSPTPRQTPSPTPRQISGGRPTNPSSSKCPNIPDDGCSICGPGKCVTDFDNIFAYPGQPAVACGVLEKAGHGAVIPLDQCGYLPQLVKNECKCRSSIPAAPKPTHKPTPSPTQRQTPSPTSTKPSTKCPDIPDDGCSICGPGKCVTDFETIFAYPGQPAVACGVMEKAGHGGVIPLDQCGYLPQLVKNDCKCRSSIPLTSESLPSPTRTPAAPKPTPSPTRKPTTIATMTPEIEFTPFNAAIYSGSDSSSSDGITIGLSIGACLLGVVITVYSIYLMLNGKNKGKDSIKDASTVGIQLEADGSSFVRSHRQKNSKTIDEMIDVDPELL